MKTFLACIVFVFFCVWTNLFSAENIANKRSGRDLTLRSCKFLIHTLSFGIFARTSKQENAALANLDPSSWSSSETAYAMVENTIQKATLSKWNMLGNLPGDNVPTLHRVSGNVLIVRKESRFDANQKYISDPDREILAYRIDRLLDLRVVPPTVQSWYKGKPNGVAQLYIVPRSEEDLHKLYPFPPLVSAFPVKGEFYSSDPISFQKIKFLRGVFMRGMDGLEFLVDKKGNAWTYDFGSDFDEIGSYGPLTYLSCLEVTPDPKTFARLKNLTRAELLQRGLQLNVDPRIVQTVFDSLKRFFSLIEKGPN